MNTTTLRPLSEQIEQSIHVAVAEDVTAAISRARVDALAAYVRELEPHCGCVFGGVLAQAIARFEDEVGTMAREYAEHVQLQKIVERLQSEPRGAA